MPRKRVRQKKLSEVDVYKRGMESSLEDARKKRIPEPTRKFEIGDRIRYGSFDWSAVLDSIDDGKIYKCFSITRNTKRNVPDYTEFKIHYEPWYSIVPDMTYEEYDEMVRLSQDDDIFFQYAQRDVMALLHMSFDNMGLDFDVEYQRGLVWTPEQKVELIRSMFHNIDIGKFCIIRRPWGNDPDKPATPLLYEVLDGKQRINAILDYYLDRFKYEGKYFSELHPFDRNHIRHYRISYAETAPLTREQKLRYFLKLNTTGIPIDPKHLEYVKNLWDQEKLKTHLREKLDIEG